MTAVLIIQATRAGDHPSPKGNVKRETFVIDEQPQNPRLAVALRYEAGRDGIPVVVAKGHGATAERIIELARENGIHVEDDALLAAALSKVEIDGRIPKELYKAVAVILGFVMKQKSRARPTS